MLICARFLRFDVNPTAVFAALLILCVGAAGQGAFAQGAAGEVIPAPPVVDAPESKGGLTYPPLTSRAEQDPSDPTTAHDPNTGQNLFWDRDKKTWVDAKTGKALGGHFHGKFATKPCPPPGKPTRTSWTGPFGGLQLGGSGSRVSTNEFALATDVQTNHFDDFGRSFGGGVNFGYNLRPWTNDVVVGAVLDANSSNDRVDHIFAGGGNFGSTINFTGSGSVRIGVLANPSLLLYGSTGLSIANQRLHINFGGPVTDTSRMTSGFNLGAGFEALAQRNTSIFAEYQHTTWNKVTLQMPAASPLFRYTFSRNTDVFRIGVRFALKQ